MTHKITELCKDMIYYLVVLCSQSGTSAIDTSVIRTPITKVQGKIVSSSSSTSPPYPPLSQSSSSSLLALHPPPLNHTNTSVHNYHSSLPSLQTPRSVLRRGPPPHLMATPPSILKVKPSTTNTTTIAEEEEDGGGKDEHTRAEEVEEQPAVPRKIRCVRTESSPGPSTQI